jgi:hypothetical protein
MICDSSKKYAVVRPNRTDLIWYNYILKKNKNGSWAGISVFVLGEFKSSVLEMVRYFENDKGLLSWFQGFDIIFLTEKDLIEKYFDQLIKHE